MATSRTLLLFLSVVIATTRTASAQPPSDLLEWLELLHNDRYKLISAIDQHDYWISVRTDPDGDILFSHFYHGDVADGDSECMLRIEDRHGNGLRDFSSKKQNPKPIEIVSKRQLALGDLTTESEFTRVYAAGMFYPLTPDAPSTVIVTYSRRTKDGDISELFRQKLLRPTHRTTKP